MDTRVAYVALATVHANYQQAVTEGPTSLLDAMPRAEQRDLVTLARLNINRAAEFGARVIVPGDEDWPTDIAHLNPDAPLALWAIGRTPLRSVLARTIAVIGSRNSTQYGVHLAQQMGYELADGTSQYTVFNGCGYGIEGAAIRGALTAHGRTPPLVVTASGVDIHSSVNTDLIRLVAGEGLLLTAAAPGTPPSRRQHLRRNQILAALAQAVVVVESTNDSDHLRTAVEAARLGRPVMALPGPVTSLQSVGTHRLIQEGAARLVAGSRDVVNHLAHLNR